MTLHSPLSHNRPVSAPAVNAEVEDVKPDVDQVRDFHARAEEYVSAWRDQVWQGMALDGAMAGMQSAMQTVPDLHGNEGNGVDMLHGQDVKNTQVNVVGRRNATTSFLREITLIIGFLLTLGIHHNLTEKRDRALCILFNIRTIFTTDAQLLEMVTALYLITHLFGVISLMLPLITALPLGRRFSEGDVLVLVIIVVAHASLLINEKHDLGLLKAYLEGRGNGEMVERMYARAKVAGWQ